MTLVSALPETIDDRYELRRLLAHGGMADVYEAHDTVLGRQVAVKVLRDRANRKRFRSEALTLARLSHPGLVTVLDAGVTDDQPWLIMEYVDGVTLADICSGIAQEPARVAAVGAQLADALAYVHGKGLVHRDVKPSNVLLTDDERVLLADFGIARLVDGGPAITETGFTIGTAAYLAPEQISGEPVTPAVDVYALGLVLLEALSGERVYPGTTPEAALARLNRPPAIPATLPNGWPELLSSVTSADPDARPAAAEVADTLHALAEGVDARTATHSLLSAAPATRPLTFPVLEVETSGSLHDEPSPWTGRPPRRSGWWGTLDRRHRGWWVLGGIVVVLLVLAPIVLLTRTPAPPPASPTKGIPPKVSTDLQHLHDAVNGR